MKRQPTEVVALVIHGCTAILAALMAIRAKSLDHHFRDFGVVLPALTQILYDLHFPAVLLAGMSMSFIAAARERGSATVFISSVAVVVAVISLALIWWALRLPYLPL